MQCELKGKRLLVLGGSLWHTAIRQFCAENGVTVVAAGNDPAAGICRMADEYYNVDATDGEAMKRLIADKRIDGVYMGGSEPVIASACRYIGELGLPCYCNETQWNALQNKSFFKELCVRFGLPVVKRFEKGAVTDADLPVITKPADGFGSNGFSVCRDRAGLEEGYRRAAEVSPTGSVVIEQFVPNDGVVVFYTVSRGQLLFSTLEDKYPVLFKPYGTYVGGLFDFESSLKTEFRELFESKIQKLIRHLGIREGNFWIEVFHHNDRYYFNEVGFRYGGSGSLYPVDYFSGLNQAAADIYYALTGKSRVRGFTPLYGPDIPRGKRYAIYPVFVKPGVIDRMEGLQALSESAGILNVLLMKKEGSRIPDNGSFGQAAVLVHLLYADVTELQNTLRHIHKTLQIRDAGGHDMVLRLIDVDGFTLR